MYSLQKYIETTGEMYDCLYTWQKWFHVWTKRSRSLCMYIIPFIFMMRAEQSSSGSGSNREEKKKKKTHNLNFKYFVIR